ncbi:hypothetical protein GCM10009805_22620 [Leucobacter chromiireducens subsp. solipictus]
MSTHWGSGWSAAIVFIRLIVFHPARAPPARGREELGEMDAAPHARELALAGAPSESRGVPDRATAELAWRRRVTDAGRQPGAISARAGMLRPS